MTDYVTMPEDIAAKLQAGFISITHYSDLIRFALLSQYGGIWIDSTIMLVDELPEAVYSRPFYTIHRRQAHNAYIAQARWSTYFLASGKGNPLMRYVFDFLVSYWRGHRKLIDYTILDYAIYMAYDRYAWVHEMIDDVPYNNERARDLIRCLNQPFDEAVYQEMTKDNTIFKLSWKEQYKTEYNGRLTFWGYIVKHRK
ncbi:MAG: capsular polysaccharide synthesis protein [Aristaeellaceae bacterium]